MWGVQGTNLVLGLMMVGGLSGMAQGAAAQESRLIFTVHIANFADVDSKTLAKAENCAAAVFRNSGIETRWVSIELPLAQRLEGTIDPKSLGPSHIQVSILSKKMADELGLAGDAMGVAPGKGLNRQLAYVFYDRMGSLAQTPGGALLGGIEYFQVTRAVILGHAIAHEIGHLLLNLELHSPTGLMRATWGMNDLLDASKGRLHFTAPQADVMRADLARRIHQEEVAPSAERESPGIGQ